MQYPAAADSTLPSAGKRKRPDSGNDRSIKVEEEEGEIDTQFKKKIKVERDVNSDQEQLQKKKKKQLHLEGSSSAFDTSSTDMINLEGATVKNEDTSFEKKKKKNKR